MKANIKVTPEDLPSINKALEEGRDVHIQRTKDGFRIASAKITVLKRVRRSTQEQKGEGI